MADHSKIEWTDATWSPVTGCTKVSTGCVNCYAERMHKRFSDEPFSKVTLHPDRLDIPLHWRKPRRIFVCSMSDLFHPDVPDSFIGRVWNIMEACPQHTFQVLTKRADRMCEWCSVYADISPLPNVWLGTSAEDQKTADERIPILLETPAAVRWVSIEPMIGPIRLPGWIRCPGCGRVCTSAVLYQKPQHPACPHCGRRHTFVTTVVDWIAVGGESGPKARPMHPAWVRSIRDQCIAAGVPFLFKQWGAWVPEGHAAYLEPDPWDESGVWQAVESGSGGYTPMMHVSKKAAGRMLDGKVWDQYPGEERNS